MIQLIESVERRVRNLGRDILPPEAKRQFWFYYMEGKRMLETRTFDLFGQVHLEVNTNCNRACSYCSNYLFPKSQEFMNMGLYKKVIDELVAIDYRGRISPNLSSEPTLHPRLVELMAEARRVKNAKLILYTDGDFLNREKFDQLQEAGVDQFVITQHGENVPKPLTELMHSLTDDERKSVRYQTLAGINLFNRGIPGLISPDRKTIPDPCFVADYEFTILVNGDVAQCGNDFAGEHIFGNVRERSIIDVWRDPKFREFRKQVRSGQFEGDICKSCVYDTPKLIIPDQLLSASPEGLEPPTFRSGI